MTVSRRDLILGALAATAASLAAAACRSGDDTALAPSTSEATPGADPATVPTTATAGSRLTPTPACGDDPTPSQTEGPYFSSGSPAKANLAADVSGGTRLALTGTVLTTDCQPLKRAKLDFWQADDGGEYDNQGFRLRGHVFTDDQGRYEITTVMPGLYPGRTRHIHVKAQPPGGRALTTQLYFPGEAANAGDGIYRKECEVAMTDAGGGGKQASFTFVLQGQ
jgi:protocatechuate 3,4-dioxygenase beta subunit